MKIKDQLLLDLLKESGPRLLAVLTRLTLDEQTAEDLLQEVFVRLCRMENPARINHLEAYACRIAIHLAFDDRRDRQKRKLFIARGGETEHQGGLGLTPEDREQIERILDAAQTLEGSTRVCFTLRYIEQMDYAQIADQLEKTPKQVRALCSKAVQRIRRMMNQTSKCSVYKEANHG